MLVLKSGTVTALQGLAARMGLCPRGFDGCGLVAEGIVGFWWSVGLWVIPWVGFQVQLGLVAGSGCCCGWVVVRGWI